MQPPLPEAALRDKARADKIRAHLSVLVEPEAAAEDGEAAQIDGAIAEAM